MSQPHALEASLCSEKEGFTTPLSFVLCGLGWRRVWQALGPWEYDPVPREAQAKEGLRAAGGVRVCCFLARPHRWGCRRL